MKTKDLHSKSPADLEKQVRKLRDSIATMQRERHLSESKNVHKLKNQRKELAQTLTILHSKNREQAKETA